MFASLAAATSTLGEATCYRRKSDNPKVFGGEFTILNRETGKFGFFREFNFRKRTQVFQTCGIFLGWRIAQEATFSSFSIGIEIAFNVDSLSLAFFYPQF
jgi:hypothetical protein